MSDDDRSADHPSATSRLEQLHRLGAASWSSLGILVLAVVVASGLSALSAVLLPLVIAVVLSTVLEPVVLALQRFRFPSAVAAAVGLLLAVTIVAGIGVVVVIGFVQQMPEISRQLVEGWNHLLGWLRSADIDTAWFDQVRKSFDDSAPQFGLGLIGVVTSTFYGLISFGIGSFFALFFLFFILRDSRLFPGWLARVSGQDRELVTAADATVRSSMRGYFRGTAITAVVTAPIFVVPLLVLDVPLVLPIVILYFFLSFVPYVGAWITAAFAVLIAFGSNGAVPALIVALSLLVSNGTVQSVVSSWALGSSLKMHPVAVMLATVIGGVVAGLIGMVLGPPLVSACAKIVAIVKRYSDAGPNDPDFPAVPAEE